MEMKVRISLSLSDRLIIIARSTGFIMGERNRCMTMIDCEEFCPGNDKPITVEVSKEHVRTLVFATERIFRYSKFHS